MSPRTSPATTPPTGRVRTHARRWCAGIPLAAALASAALVGLAGCGAGSTVSSAARDAAPARVAAPGGMAVPGGTVAPGGTAVDSLGSAAAGRAEAAGAAQKASSGTGLAGVSPEVRLVRTADLTIEVKVLATAAAKVRAAAESFGGTVASEVTGFSQPAQVTSSDGSAASAAEGQSVLVLRIPVNDLDNAIARISGIGKTLSRSSTSQDVTADLADLGSRVKTATASVDRVRALLAQAKSLQDIVLLESELTRRESDLEALQARQASLAGRADLSTLTVSVQTPAVEVQVTPDNGFVTGLKSGWHSLTRSAVAVLDVVGAVLPWLLLAGLVAWPSYVIVRRRRTRRTHPSPPLFEPSGQSGPSGPGEGSPAPEAQRPDLDPVP